MSIRLTKPICLFLLIAIAVSIRTRYFIPHSHDDLGWLMTVDEYYNQRVRNIFDSVIDALLHTPKTENPNILRKFVYSEVGFLKIYLEEHQDTKADKVAKIKQLIENNQWEFVNGGISQSDSACPHYEDIIENYFYGLSYLKRHFNRSSAGAWQLDPFGHSKALLYVSRLFGMKHSVINRIGDFKKIDMFKNHTLEFTYNFPNGLSQTTHVTTNHYSSPDGIGCDGDCDFSKFDKNTLDRFLNEFDARYAYDPYHLVGDDFQYQHAQNNFDYLDQVLGLYTDIRYSLLSDYLKDFDGKEKELTTFDGDFFVYDESNGDNWSGYFTTKPLLKNKIKKLGQTLRSFKNFYFSQIIKGNKTTFDEVNDLLSIAEDFGVLLHHDCITGTAKRATDDDYFKRIIDINDRITKIVAVYLKNAVQICDINTLVTDTEKCIINDIADNNEIYVYVFNSSNYSYENRLVKFTVVSKPDTTLKVQISGPDGNFSDVDSDVYSQGKYCDLLVRDNTSNFALTKYKIVYTQKSEKAFLSNSFKDNTTSVTISDIITDDGSEQSGVRNAILETDSWTIIIFDDNVVISSKLDPMLINSIYYEYLYSDSSGAYILKYDNEPDFKSYNRFYKATLTQGQFADTVFVKGDRVDLTITFDRNYQDLYELNSYVRNDDIFLDGIDVILNVKSFSVENSDFSTDSNGLFEMPRATSSKFENSVYPVASFIKLEDNSGQNLTVFVDRAEGGTSLEPGVVKLFIQRSTITDDYKGVDETVLVREDVSVTHRVLNSTKSAFDDRFVDIMNCIEQEPAKFYSLHKPANVLGSKNTSNQLSNINLRIVADFVDDKSFFVRVQNIHRRKKVTETYSYNDLLKQIYGEYKFEEVAFDYLFNGEGEQPSGSSDDLVSIEPLEFKSFIARAV